MSTMNVTIIYQTKELSYTAIEAQIETQQGIRTILPEHQPLCAALKQNSALELVLPSREAISIPILDGIAIIERTAMQILVSQ